MRIIQVTHFSLPPVAPRPPAPHAERLASCGFAAHRRQPEALQSHTYSQSSHTARSTRVHGHGHIVNMVHRRASSRARRMMRTAKRRILPPLRGSHASRLKRARRHAGFAVAAAVVRVSVPRRSPAASSSHVSHTHRLMSLKENVRVRGRCITVMASVHVHHLQPAAGRRLPGRRGRGRGRRPREGEDPHERHA